MRAPLVVLLRCSGRPVERQTPDSVSGRLAASLNQAGGAVDRGLLFRMTQSTYLTLGGFDADSLVGI